VVCPTPQQYRARHSRGAAKHPKISRKMLARCRVASKHANALLLRQTIGLYRYWHSFCRKTGPRLFTSASVLVPALGTPGKVRGSTEQDTY
jgi:hypothetical protein